MANSIKTTIYARGGETEGNKTVIGQGVTLEGTRQAGYRKVDEIDVETSSISQFCKRNSVTESAFWLSMCPIVLLHLNGSYSTTFYVSTGAKKFDHEYSILSVSLSGEKFGILDIAKSMEETLGELDSKIVHEICPGEVVNEACLILDLHSEVEGDCNNSTIPMISIRLSASSETFSEVELFSRIIKQMLEQVMTAPATNIHDLSSVTQEELRQMSSLADLKIPNGPSCVHQLMQQHLEGTPNDIAVDAHDGSFTYEDLNRHTAQIAQLITSKGIERPSRVILCLKKSKWAIVGWLGVLRSGNTCVPLDSNVPPSRARHIIKDTASQMALVDSSTSTMLGGLVEKTIRLGGSAIEEIGEWVDVAIPNQTPAAIVFTSGSTGTPKGVVQSHAAVAAGIKVVTKAMKLQKATRFLQFASLSFDVSICEIFAPLTVGGCVCVPSQDNLMRDLQAIMKSMSVNVACLSSSIIHTLDPGNTGQLRNLFTGGERVDENILRAWTNATNLHIVYGTTETGVWDTVTQTLKADDDPGNVGVPIGCSAWVVNRVNPNLLCAPGVLGELYIFGPCVACGYLAGEKGARAAFTRELSWMENLPDNPECRGFLTGDLAIRNNDGSIKLLGRADSQIKLRGQRIEPAEIESVILRALPHGVNAAIEKIEAHGQERLVCFLAHKDEKWEELSDTSLLEIIKSTARKAVAEELPRYMAPSEYVFRKRLPRTMTNKLDRAELRRSMIFNSSHADPIKKKPSSSVEDLQDQVRRIVFEFGPENHNGTNFDLQSDDCLLSELGLDSIQLAKLSRAFQVELSVSIPMSVFTDQSARITSLTQFVQANMSNDRKDPNLREVVEKWQKRFRSIRKRNVFITGGTGFLGIQIVRKLLEEPSIGEIIALVRAKSSDDAMEKIESAAQTGKCWTERIASNVKVWLGDLSQEMLGLESQQWNSVVGRPSDRPQIDIIIHNGAVVNWNADFAALEKVNVGSTFQLLSGLSKSVDPPRMVYVSGGTVTSSIEDAKAQISYLKDSGGYDQSKLVSEILIHEYNTEQLRQGAPRTMASIVRPGFVIGTAKEGVCNPKDYIWRLTKAIVKLGHFSAEEGDRWLQVLGAETVAESILEVAMQPPTEKSETLTLLDGLPLRSFLAQLSELGLHVSPVSHDRWIEMLYSDMKLDGESHPLYPLADWVERTEGRIGISEPAKSHLSVCRKQINAAVTRSMEFLHQSGYLK